jgi:HTH-type transcriptional regulator, sugar sensing transcriptional regulator
MDYSQHTPVDRLLDLGFSQYEAQAYVGLLGREPMTGYSLANLTGIPQPKVYETLRRLARKGAAIQVGGDPALFVALPPDRLLAQLDSDFRQRLAQAREELDRPALPGAKEFRVLRSMTDWPAIERAAVAMLDAAGRHYYVSLNSDRPQAIAEAIARADERGVRGDILHFGDADGALGNARVIRHLSTDGVVYRHHQARHLAVVADGTRVLWALAADGIAWEAATADDGLIAAAVKGYIRHDMYVQQITSDFGPLLQEKYGPGLNALVQPAPRETAHPAGPEPEPADGPQPRRRGRRTA